MLKMFPFDKLFLAFTKLTKRLRSKESKCIRYEYMKCDRNPAEKWGKLVTKKKNPDMPNWGTDFFSGSREHSSQLPGLLDLFQLRVVSLCVWIVCIKTSNPCWAQRAPTLGVCSSKQFWELRADHKLIKKEYMWLLILTRPDPDWRQQVDSTPNNQANTP